MTPVERKGSKREFFDIWFSLLILNQLARLKEDVCSLFNVKHNSKIERSLLET